MRVGMDQDTYFDYDCEECSEWLHGAVWVNGFNVGRYFQVSYSVCL